MNDIEYSILIDELDEYISELNCWPEEIFRTDDQWYMASNNVNIDHQEITPSEAYWTIKQEIEKAVGTIIEGDDSESNVFKLMKEEISRRNNQVKCLICEKGLDPVSKTPKPKAIEQYYYGGDCEISFHYGSRFDWLGFRSPVTKDNKIVGSKPRAEAANSDIRTHRLSSCSDIRFAICDDCFETKSHLFRGYEKNEDGKLELVVE